jgi:hypothetical protein
VPAGAHGLVDDGAHVLVGVPSCWSHGVGHGSGPSQRCPTRLPGKS